MIVFSSANAMPEWFGSALLGGVIAAIGYVAKSLIELYIQWHTRKRERRAQLVRLRSLLNASRVTFLIQNEHAQRLLGMLKERQPDLNDEGGYEQTFANAYPTFTSEEKELHAIIRGLTIHALRPANAAVTSWLESDTHYFVRNKLRRRLADELGDLETHLRLWAAKYEVWIEERPEHALVYLADEQRHGAGFPNQIDKLVNEALEHD